MSGAVAELAWQRPTTLECARGLVFGESSPDPSLAKRARAIEASMTPRIALEAAILPALQQSPCVVTFSGGRDSSAVLSVATALARRAGLPDPIPLSRYVAGSPETDESPWQELVVRHLGLEHWERVTLDEMDLLGPMCTASLVERGIVWPPLLHSWPALFAQARGGAILTGEGGDELFDPRRTSALSQLSHHPERFRRKDFRRAVLQALSPGVMRRHAIRKQELRHVPPWLTPGAQEVLLDELVRWELGEPRQWLASVARHISDRSHVIAMANLKLLAHEQGADLIHPLLDVHFVAACARLAGRYGFASRTTAMWSLFRDFLPDAILRRTDKADFTGVALACSTRAWADQWTGQGFDPEIVNAETLRACLRDEQVTAAVGLAIQVAWLHDHQGREAAAK